MYDGYLRWVIADKQNQLVVMLIILGQTGLVRCNWAQKSQDYCTFQYILRPYLGLWQFHIWCTFKCNFMGDVPFGVFWTRSVVILWVICVIAGHISHFLALMLHVSKITRPKKNKFVIKLFHLSKLSLMGGFISVLFVGLVNSKDADQVI